MNFPSVVPARPETPVVADPPTLGSAAARVQRLVDGELERDIWPGPRSFQKQRKDLQTLLAALEARS